MSEPTTKKAKLNLHPARRKLIFDKIFQGNPSFDIEDEFFKKDSNELAEENNPYTDYIVELKTVEVNAAKVLFECAQSKFFLKANGTRLEDYLLKQICTELGPFLFDFVDKELTDELRIKVTQSIQTVIGKQKEKCGELLKILHLDRPVKNNQIFTRIPYNSKGNPWAPCSMTAQVQLQANEDNNCYIYPFPFAITPHFPVFFCHPVFADFMDILHERNPNSPAVLEYKKFMEDGGRVSSTELDKCLADLIVAVLDEKTTKKSETEFVQEIHSALSRIFTLYSIQTNSNVSSVKRLPPGVQIDLAVFIDKFPFIIVEAKNNSYSIDTVLQGFQYYGLTTKAELIDNDPAFLITLDKGIFYLYGMAKVNSRVVCSCLLSLEFTNYHFNVEGFTGTLYRCLSGLLFFYNQFSERIKKGKNNDLQHKEYCAIKSALPDIDSPMPFPAIFSVKSIGEQAPIKISFKPIKEDPYFKPCVYLVETLDNKLAVLKIASNYNIDVHNEFCQQNLKLAPQLIGYDSINNQFKVILMEYSSSHDTLLNHLDNDIEKSLDRKAIIRSLEEILAKLRALGLVHGDFRSSNIIAKRSEEDPTVLEDFKLIDFEFSGKVNDPYPFLALKNNTIDWHKEVSSFAPRKFEHDEHLFDDMRRKELK